MKLRLLDGPVRLAERIALQERAADLRPIPCPFCGASSQIAQFAALWHGECGSCSACGPLADTPELAGQFWDRRVRS